jgi:hypothetical protein
VRVRRGAEDVDLGIAPQAIAPRAIIVSPVVAAVATPHPQAGSFGLDLRIPTSYVASDSGPLMSCGLQLGLGRRLSDRFYVGGLISGGMLMNMGEHRRRGGPVL